jgi:2,5-diamino-6-(ribosylamino)-4(3H)-pyrimidinone 5'-phosphate reductase
MPRKSRSERPHVTVNMAMSLDGKITTYRREIMALGTEHDRRLMDELRAEADAVIVGAGTVKHDGHPILMRYADLEEKRVQSGRPAHPANVTMSRTLDLPSTRPFFRHPDPDKIVFTTKSAPPSRVARLSRLADVVVLPGRTISPGAVLENLYRRNFRRVLLEGGGEVHFAFAKEGVIDDVYVTITPRLIGGSSAPTLLDGRGFLAADHIELRLLSSRRIGDELYVKYRVVRD